MSPIAVIIKEVEVARNHFENASADYVAAAIYELAAAEQKLSAALEKGKKNVSVFVRCIGVAYSGQKCFRMVWWLFCSCSLQILWERNRAG